MIGHPQTQRPTEAPPAWVAALSSSMALLTREQRVAWCLRYDAYMRAGEIAAVLGMPRERVWAVLREARVVLRGGAK